MNRIPNVKASIPPRNAVTVLLISALLAPIAHAQGNEAILQTAGNVPYVSGGIGIDAINRLDTMTGQFNVKLVFAFRSGEYLSDVKVTIIDAAGKTIMDTMSDGPWFLTKLRPGQYQIVASFAGQSERRTIAVGAARLNTVDFRWNAQ
jgi:hypothetical protein